VALPFFTVGHSDRSLEAFVALLRDVDIALVADIRKMPRSRTNPQFNEETLPVALADFHISYEHEAALGGLRGRTPILSQDVNGLWTNKSFRNYADYALTEPFQAAVEHLLDEGRKQCCTIICSEALGGDVTAASSPTISLPMGRLFSTCWSRNHEATSARRPSSNWFGDGGHPTMRRLTGSAASAPRSHA
jgi:hypothetical protein